MKFFRNLRGTSVDDLIRELGEVRTHYAALADRLERIEARQSENHLLVLEAAEKVAARLKDRSRKRRAAQEEDDDDDEHELVPVDPWMRRS